MQPTDRYADGFAVVGSVVRQALSVGRQKGRPVCEAGHGSATAPLTAVLQIRQAMLADISRERIRRPRRVRGATPPRPIDLGQAVPPPYAQVWIVRRLLRPVTLALAIGPRPFRFTHGVNLSRATSTALGLFGLHASTQSAACICALPTCSTSSAKSCGWT